MKISRVIANNRKHVWEVSTRTETLVFPYSRAAAVPSANDPIVELFVDPELANEGFTYRLKSGVEDSVLWDQVLDYNSDPDYISGMDVYKLTVEAKRRFAASDLSVREVARRMRTSPTQVYRLLDTTNRTKPMRQMLSLLRVLGLKPEIRLEANSDPADGTIDLARELMAIHAGLAAAVGEQSKGTQVKVLRDELDAVAAAVAKDPGLQSRLNAIANATRDTNELQARTSRGVSGKRPSSSLAQRKRLKDGNYSVRSGGNTESRSTARKRA